MTKGQNSFFKVEDVAQWSGPASSSRVAKHQVKNEDTDDEYIDYAPTNKGKGRRVGNASQNTSKVAKSTSKIQVSNKRDILHNKITANKVNKNIAPRTIAPKNNNNVPYHAANDINLYGQASNNIVLPFRPLPSSILPYAASNNTSNQPTTRTRTPRAPIVPRYDANGVRIREPNVRWNEPMMINVLFGVLQAVNITPALDTTEFFNKVGNIVTSNPNRPITGNAIIQRLTKLQHLRRAAVTPGVPVNTIADLVGFSQEHQRGKDFLGVYTKKDLGVTVALTPPYAAVAGQALASSSQVEEDEDEDEEEVEEEEELEEDTLFTPEEWLAGLFRPLTPGEGGFEMGNIPPTQFQPDLAPVPFTAPWGWTPAIAPPQDLQDPIHPYEWAFGSPEDEAWAMELSGGMPAFNNDSSFTGLE